MGKQTFVPLTAELIDEGGFLESLNTELLALQSALVEFVEKHGAKAIKAAAELELKIKLVNLESGGYSISSQMKSTTPKRPVTVSIAVSGETESGAKALFVRCTGSDETPPQQGKLFKTHGSDPAE